jgi:hypothetical protein
MLQNGRSTNGGLHQRIGDFASPLHRLVRQHEPPPPEPSRRPFRTRPGARHPRPGARHPRPGVRHFETRDEAFLAWGKAFETRGKAFLAWGKAFETRGKAFLARGKANRLSRGWREAACATIQVWFASTEASGAVGPGLKAALGREPSPEGHNPT